MSRKPDIQTRSVQKNVRLTPQRVGQASRLAYLWSPVVPLSFADVVAEAIRRAYEAEIKARNGRPVKG